MPDLLTRLLAPRTRYALAWVLVFVAASVALGYAWLWGRAPGRADGNRGHVTIDFGGQWLVARMVATGQGPSLYSRGRLLAEAERAYPAGDRGRDQGDSDGEALLSMMVGTGDGVGGALYPPVHAVLFSPLGALPPRVAYRLAQVSNLALGFLAGWLISRLTATHPGAGGIWWPVATLMVFLWPGYGGAINLGQNPVLSLVLVLAGWLALTRGRPALGGFLWGCLAFKPVWAVAFLPVLLLSGRWRAATAMTLTGAGLILLTLPVVGVGAWFDWLEVGRLATATYDSDETWTFLSRDLVGVPRRYLLHFEDGVAADPEQALAWWLGRGLWWATMAVTAGVALGRWRRVRADAGPGPGLLLLGAWLSCFHFMYYDTLLAVPGAAVLLAPRAGVRWYRTVPPWAVLTLIGLGYLGPLADPTWHFPPFDTAVLWGLWAWCVRRVLREAER